MRRLVKEAFFLVALFTGVLLWSSCGTETTFVTQLHTYRYLYYVILILVITVLALRFLQQGGES
jgi:TRAP-type C4-dicarboxylate transport system permease small subunit